MNIFALHIDPAIAAQLHCDKHVIKMITETTQILSTNFSILGLAPAIETHSKNTLYKPYNPNHRCVKWARDTTGNLYWTAELLRALILEYEYRYGPDYSKFVKARQLTPYFQIYSKQLFFADDPESRNRTPFVMAMPEQYQQADPVLAYQAYYREEKARFAVWTKRPIPDFMFTKPGNVL